MTSPRTASFYGGALCLLLVLSGCSSSKPAASDQAEDLVVRGRVVYPGQDSVAVAGAMVATLPYTELATTKADGSFIIQQGLEPGDYEFTATFGDQQGKTTIPIEFGDPREVLIQLGRTLSMVPLDSAGVFDKPPLPGNKTKRTGG